MPEVTLTLEDGSRHDLESDPAAPRSLADLLASRGFPLNTRCGNRGLCSGCEVDLLEGEVKLGTSRITAPALIHACQARITGPVAIGLPARSRMEHRPQVSESFRIDVPSGHQPLFDPIPDVRDVAFAVDIGTTTVVVLLVDLVSGEVLARAGGFNQQIRFGDNVLTRIDAGREPEAVCKMQHALVAETIVPLLDRACQRAGIPHSRIAGAAIAGNTTMLHLLTGEDPTPLGIAPFTPRFIAGRRLDCAELGLSDNAESLAPDTPVQLLPGIAGYIGADIVAGLCATGLAFDESPSLLVDIGTNGEVVLQHDGRLIGCATAAGPAFEGSGLRCGSRARDGAVSALKLALDPFRVDADIIGDGPAARAVGICGSAYIDFLAQGRHCGLLTASGRFDPAAWAAVPASHQLLDDDERALRLAASDGAKTVAISEVDIALLLQAKAAIGAGIETLLMSAGIQPASLGRVCLAGGFGMHLDVPHAIAIGLLPGFRPDQIEVVGNTSLAGSLLALVDRGTLAEMESLRQQVEILELNLQDGFEDRYIDHLTLP